MMTFEEMQAIIAEMLESQRKFSLEQNKRNLIANTSCDSKN